MNLKVSSRVGVRITFVFVIALAAATVAQDRRSQDLDQPLDHVPGEVLVKFLPGTPPGIANQALALLSGRRLGRFDRIGVEHWRAGRGVSTEQALDALSRPPFRNWVEYAEPNYIRHTFQTYPDDPLRGDLWSLLNYGQTGGTNGADIAAIPTWADQGTGEPIVAVIDSGVDYRHPDLAANMHRNPDETPGNGEDDDGNGYVDDVYGWDFVNGDDDPIDDNGHGTHVSGTIAAVGNDGIGVMGVSWRAKIMALKFLNAGGSGSDANAILAINYARDNGASIINASWGGGPKSQSLSNAIAACNCLFVASAGNSGNSKVNYPAGYPLTNIISVAATDHNDALATFSSYGSAWVDLAAPGVNIFSTYRNGAYRTMSGTSMAAPHVSGVAALLLANGDPASDLKATIMAAVDTRPSLAGKMVTGGRLNAAKALGLPPPLQDNAAPGPVGTLSVTNSTQNSLRVSWTAGGDDGAIPTAYLYDMRYSTSQINGDNWADATPVIGEPAPLPAGTYQEHVLADLDAGTEYYVGLKAVDESGNTSELLTAGPAATLLGPKWVIETINDPEGAAEGFYHALAFDSGGNPAIAYSGANGLVRFAIQDSAGWHFSTADTGDAGIGLALGPGNRPAISHGWGKLRFAEGTTGGAPWLARVLESGPKNDLTSIAFYGDEPWIAYRGGGNTMPLKLTHRQNGVWVTETVDAAGGGRYASLVFDGAAPTIAYSADLDSGGTIDTLKFARKDGGSWSIQNVESDTLTDPGFGVQASLAYDPQTGHPTIAHAALGGIRFVRWTGSAWVPEVVAVGRNSSLAYDPKGNLPTVVYSTSDYKLWWAKPGSGNEWEAEAVDRKANVVWVACLKFDTLGNPAVLYSDYATKTLRLARRVPQ